MKNMILAGFIFTFALTPVLAQNVTPVATVVPTVETIDRNAVVPDNPASTAKLVNQQPAQAESDKAPASDRPTAVPQFALPDVVITGENELTIGAKRGESMENNVTWGAQNLTDLNRSNGDLPGLDKSLTALSTEETGNAKDTTLILHGGGGVPGTLGGWGLAGKDFTDFDVLFLGYYSTWGGQATNGSFDGDQKYRYGGEVKLRPSDDVHFRFSLYSSQVSATLPYQNAIQEIHQGTDLNSSLNLRWSNVWHSEVLLSSKITDLNYWDRGNLSNQAQELDGRVRFIGEEIDPFWNALSLEVGYYQENSNFAVSPNNSYNLGWANVQTRFNFTDNLDLNGSVEGQSGNGPNLNSKLFPAVNLRWRFLDNSQVTAYWKTARSLDRFFDTFMDREHISPESELPTATENTGEWGVKLTQKLDESTVVNVTASIAQYQNYHQWTDINPVSINYIETYSTLPAVQINRVIADYAWKIDPQWKTDLNYQWTQGINNSGNSLNMTFLPQNQGTVSLTRADETWDATIALVMVSDFQALDSVTLDLPAYATLNLSAAYHVTRGFSLWLKGDNLLGASYMLTPGYLEPQYHVRGGIEVIF